MDEDKRDPSPSPNERAGIESLARLMNVRIAEATKQEHKRRSKVREVGLFAAGLGTLFIALALYLGIITRNLGTIAVAMLLVPGAAMMVCGVIVLATRSRASVWIAAILASLGLAIDGLVSFNLIRLIAEAAAIVLVWRTVALALDELDSEAASA